MHSATEALRRWVTDSAMEADAHEPRTSEMSSATGQINSSFGHSTRHSEEIESGRASLEVPPALHGSKGADSARPGNVVAADVLRAVIQGKLGEQARSQAKEALAQQSAGRSHTRGDLQPANA